MIKLSWMSWMWKRQKSRPRPKIGVLLDYENIASEAISKGSTISFKGLSNLFKECAKLGNLILPMAFLPDHFIKNSTGGDVLQDLHTAGFYPIPCKSTNSKNKDKVDSIMVEVGKSLIDETQISRIVIVSHDGDFIPLFNYATSHGVKPLLMSGKKISFIFKKIAEGNRVTLPSLNK